MTANTPPKPHTEGMEWTNTETGIKYQFTNGAWRAVSSKALEDVIDLIQNAADIFYGDIPPTDEKYDLWFDTKRTELCVKHEDMWMPASIGGVSNGNDGVVPTLEQVLQAGPFADIPIVLTDGEEAFIDVDPRENRLLIAGTDNGDPLQSKPPRISLIHLTPGSDGQGRADIELDEGGKRLDFEMLSGVDNIHFRFEEDEKFILNKEGDAEFIGKVKASPATEPDELATLSQIEESMLSPDDFTVTYENFGYINTTRADFDFDGNGHFTLEMGDGDKDNYWYATWVNRDKNGNTINWIDEAEPGQKLNKGDHLRIYQPSTGGVVIFKADDYSSVWAPSYALPRSNSNAWLVNRGRFVFGEPVVIQVGVYTEPAIQGGSTLGDEMTNWPELPKFWKWKYTEGANTVPSEGFSIDRDITMNTAAPLLISLKGRDGQVIKGPSATRTFGEGSTVICYDISNDEHRIMWSAVLQQITMRKDQGWMECYISKRSNQNYMTNNNLYMLKLSAFGN